ncbi:FAD:protein FMN transferase [Labrenzia aggregata]|uniref:FAD:protein FMN transferase n=2 Tax=Roseibium aggregatum TaxID=187304 RepID=A0A939EGB3_9HYPH|nr:FAD:protein FMN transferase [Roseibium aggregatum]
MDRRRFLKICATAAAGLALPAAAAAGTASLHRWTGIALGARAEVNLIHHDAEEARRLFSMVEAEIRRLENIFSLYRPESELSRLNRTGRLQAPSFEMLELLGLCSRIHAVTAGAFDPTVQPLWQYYAQKAVGEKHAGSFAEARSRTGFGNVRVLQDEISLLKPGMALTLNGIAQGAVTDRVAALLSANGCRNVVVDLGEISAQGHGPDPVDAGHEAGWSVTLRPAPERDGSRVGIQLADAAVASSARRGTTFDPEGRQSHILDPRTGLTVKNGLAGASVVARTAAIADGLSTAALVCRESDLKRSLAAFDGTRAFVVRDDGTQGWVV